MMGLLYIISPIIVSTKFFMAGVGDLTLFKWVAIKNISGEAKDE